MEKKNPYLNSGTIDPHLGVIGVNSASGKPIATLWNYATHGTCYGPSNMKFSSDIAGAVCDLVEDTIGGVALFVNADAGDIDPTSETCGCNNGHCQFSGAPKFVAQIKKIRDRLRPTSNVVIKVASEIIPFGPTNLNMTLARNDDCDNGGELDICTICRIINCDINLHLGDAWLQQYPRFTALSFTVNQKTTGMVTVPGEALVELGWWIRNGTMDLGFDQNFLLGYSNDHMGYFATPDQYDLGGYESLLSFWGIKTAQMIFDGTMKVADQLKPSR